MEAEKGASLCVFGYFGARVTDLSFFLSSNFFDAIQFVLVAPKFATLRQEDRQNLLHEG